MQKGTETSNLYSHGMKFSEEVTFKAWLGSGSSLLATQWPYVYALSNFNISYNKSYLYYCNCIHMYVATAFVHIQNMTIIFTAQWPTNTHGAIYIWCTTIQGFDDDFTILKDTKCVYMMLSQCSISGLVSWAFSTIPIHLFFRKFFGVKGDSSAGSQSK